MLNGCKKDLLSADDVVLFCFCYCWRFSCSVLSPYFITLPGKSMSTREIRFLQNTQKRILIRRRSLNSFVYACYYNNKSTIYPCPELQDMGKKKIGELQEVASCRTQRGPWVWKYSVADERKNFCKYKTLRVFLLQHQQQQGPQFNGAKTRPKECGCIEIYWRSAFWFPAQAKVAEKSQQWQQESNITLPLVWECRNFLTTK